MSINSKSVATPYYEGHVAQSTINSLVLAKKSGKYYAVTTKTVHRLPLDKCDQYRSCDQCVLAADPLCGWCIFDNRCSRKSACTNDTYWFGRGDTSRCINITSTSPSSVSVDSQVKISIQLVNLHSLPIVSYTCSYGPNYGEYVATFMKDSSDTLQCLTPRYAALSNAMPVHGYRNIPLSIVVNLANSAKRIVIARQSIQFYNCTSYQSSCATCTRSPFDCAWCLYDHTCNSNANSCSTASIGRNSAWQSGICPVVQSSKITVPLNVYRQITVTGKNLLPERNSMRYLCNIDIDGSIYQVPATYINSTTLRCQEARYTIRSQTSKLNSSLRISMGNGKLIDSTGPITG